MCVPAAPLTELPSIVAEGSSDHGPDDESPLSTNPFPTAAAPQLFHIPCPEGHPLETLPEMLGKWAMCPVCGEKFKLERKCSIEFQNEEQQRQARAEAELSRRWLNGAIVAVVLTLLGLALLLLIGSAY